MAGPGGGARGGGFSGGGGRSSGGFGGGHRGGGYHHHHHHHGFWYFGRRRYYGGGCLTGLAGMILAPAIMIILAAVLLITSVGSAFSSVANGGSIVYDEAKFQDYANKEYYSRFGTYAGKEDNILIVFLVDDKASEFSCIAWVGDNIRTEINNMFGGEGTAFGNAVTSSVNQSYYAYSLDSNLASAIEIMTGHVKNLSLDSSFKNPTAENSRPESKLVNKTELQLSEETVNSALSGFTAATGIPIAISVDTMEAVFGKTIFTGDLIFVILGVGLIGLAIFLIVKNIIAAKKEKRERGEKKDDNIFDNETFG